MLSGDPLSVIPCDDENILLRCPGEEMDLPSFRDGLNAVDEEIGDRQIDLAHIDPHQGQVLLKMDIHPCVLHLGVRPQQPDDRVQDVVQLDPLKFQGRKTVKIEKLFEIILQTEGFVTDEIEKGLNLLLLGKMDLFPQFVPQ